MSLTLVSTICEARRAILHWREKGETVALVPTMGALHKGHLALLERARGMAKRTVVSLFVNPLQFGPKEDLARYPHTLETDRKLLTEAGSELLYAPEAGEMYPEGFATKIDTGPLGTVLEGAFRPGFFTGVATVVAKLLLQLMPDAALFGEKDYQQLLVIRRMVRDLDIPVHIAEVPIAREADGLACSSRNAYLSADERRRAVTLPRTLRDLVASFHADADIETALKGARARLEEAGFSVDYIELADAKTLAPVRATGAPARLLAAARIGTTRLIDNLAVNAKT